MKIFSELLTDLQRLFKLPFLEKQKVAKVAKPSFSEFYTIINKCGCTSIDGLYGTKEEHEKQIRLEAAKMCFSCQIMLWNQKALENARQKGYPNLIGSEKQVAWALNIRDRFNLDLPPDHPLFSDESVQPYLEIILSLRERLASNAEAAWWIDNRRKLQGKSFIDLVEKVRKRYKSHHIIIKYINEIGC